MNSVAIIQARLSSTRLPRKVLLPLPTGRTVIEEVVFRARLIRGIDMVVVATPDDEGDEIQDTIFRSDKLGGGDDSLPKVFVFQGPHHDVLKRYALAAEAFDADVVMRITADCPLIAPDVCAKVLQTLLEEQYDYVSNVHPRSFPTGYDCEVFRSPLLVEALSGAKEPHQREHVTPWFTEVWPRFRLGKITQADFPYVDHSSIRWTLDTSEDYQRICDEFNYREQRVAAA